MSIAHSFAYLNSRPKVVIDIYILHCNNVNRLEKDPADKPTCFRCAARIWDGAGYFCDPAGANRRRGVDGWRPGCNMTRSGNIHRASNELSAQTMLRKLPNK